MPEGLISDYSILNGGKYFVKNGCQNYFDFQPFSRYFTSKNGKTGSWQSKGMWEESAIPLSTIDTVLVQK